MVFFNLLRAMQKNSIFYSLSITLLCLLCSFQSPLDTYAQEVTLHAQATSPRTVVVRWQLKSAAETIPIAYFEVERSVDGRNFKTIETVQSHQQDCYFFVDKEAYASRLHYRLKILSSTGRISYSETIPVDVILTLAEKQFVPSKVETPYIKIHLPSEDKHATIQIYDVEGVLYFSVEADKSPLIIDIHGWQNGEYYVHYRSRERIEVNKILVEQ